MDREYLLPWCWPGKDGDVVFVAFVAPEQDDGRQFHTLVKKSREALRPSRTRHRERRLIMCLILTTVAGFQPLKNASFLIFKNDLFNLTHY